MKKLLLLLLSPLLNGQPRFTVESPLSWLQISPGADYKSVTVTNNGSVAISILSLIYTSDAPGVPPQTKNYTYHSFGAKTPMFPPGQSRTLTPQRWFTNGAVQVHVTVDLVVSADNRSAGRDTLQIVKRFQDEQKAYEDLQNDLAGRIANGESTASILSRLERLKAQPIITGKHYDNFQIRTAKDWYDIISHVPERMTGIINSATPEKLHPSVKFIKEGALQ